MYSYLCNVCDLGFISGKELITHVDEIHTKMEFENSVIKRINRLDTLIRINLRGLISSKINIISN